MTVFIEVSIGSAPHQVPFAHAESVAAAAAAAGVTGLRLVEGDVGSPTVDPSITAAYLAVAEPVLAYLVDASTSHNAPYNLARRIGSLDRATGGRTGLVLRPGAGDEVSDPVTPDPAADTDAAQRWGEYTDVLAQLWDSFPADALVGNQTAGVVVDDEQLVRIDHEGALYRVRGPLDGPGSPQGRPPLVTDRLDTVGADAVVARADAVIIAVADVADALPALTEALSAAARPRETLAILARVGVDESADRLVAWAADAGVDGFVVADAGNVDATIGAVRTVAAGLVGSGTGTLRASLGLAPRLRGLESAAVLA
ncbi:LLM class flavin-dependent oxidoreductase [Gordonia humi]|uniref:Alkanesulfonate monooxygenase SsuD/methylene tetrahydromethanopterin reductase-like flavin-dependent oxidoreductase (Luciferase family) n=1 Tax=Gordonia humi TaxID=686429 RepID=A0A840EYR9_9ACTN|nr:LLM class flavin-dependent oxidoreductase [Gordonia humi]MBB4135413.1 alkanesulfonate monooxygenase SsuD/methylene tetrahydromethanopterin reductase-like flavin-dependent oxidoreductase (luciferase family) [Gordonia humi]